MSSLLHLRASFKCLFAAGLLGMSAMLAGCSSSEGGASGPPSASSGGQSEAKPVMASAQQPTAEQPRQHVLAFPTGDRSTSAFLLEKEMPPEVRLNKTFDYQLRVTNQTDQPMHNIIVREQVPAGLTITGVAAATTRPAENGVVEYTIGDLGPKESKSVTVTAIASQPGTKDICATVNYTPSLCVRTDVINPILKLSKSGPGDADICDRISYTYAVHNEGSGTERNIHVEDRLAEGLTTSDGGNVVSLDFGDLSGGQSKDQSVTLKATRMGSFSSQAIATAGEGDKAESEWLATAIHAPKLDLKIDGPQTSLLNKPVTYHVTVTNTGDSQARDLAMGVQAPNGTEVAWTTGGQPQLLSTHGQEPPAAQPTPPPAPPKEMAREEYHGAGGPGQPEHNLIPGRSGTEGGTPGGTKTETGTGAATGGAAGGTASMQTSGGQMMASGQQTIASLAPGQSQSFDVTVPNPQPGVLKLSANAQARCAQPASASAQTDIQALSGLMLSVVDEADPVRIGDTVTYDITVKNQGAGEDHNVMITATLPAGESYISSTGPTEAQVNGQTITFGSIDTLRGGQTVVWKVQAKALQAGDVRFKAALSSQGLTSGPATAEEPTRLY